VTRVRFRGLALPALAALLTIAGALLLSSCWREKRELRTPPAATTRKQALQIPPLRPGPGQPSPKPSQPSTVGAYENNSFAVARGQELFEAYNCSGCHFHGGGGMGPPLMDQDWMYGKEPEQVYASIAEGRPNGMPAWGARIPSDQIWQLVAYVRSMSGLQRFDVTPGRSDEMATKPEQNPKPPGQK
jgi:cytochrome c oxidase cbb3-type subunit 3